MTDILQKAFFDYISSMEIFLFRLKIDGDLFIHYKWEQLITGSFNSLAPNRRLAMTPIMTTQSIDTYILLQVSW